MNVNFSSNTTFRANPVMFQKRPVNPQLPTFAGKNDQVCFGGWLKDRQDQIKRKEQKISETTEAKIKERLNTPIGLGNDTLKDLLKCIRDNTIPGSGGCTPIQLAEDLKLSKKEEKILSEAMAKACEWGYIENVNLDFDSYDELSFKISRKDRDFYKNNPAYKLSSRGENSLKESL